MALSVEKNATDGIYYVSGVTGQNVPYPIGRRYFKCGQHHVGFDDSFSESLVVKAFYDPEGGENLPPGQYIGYMQFMQLSFAGQPIPPQVYGGQLADRAPYVSRGAWEPYVFVDFMGPHHANLYKPSDNLDSDDADSFEPFYAYNGLLYAQQSLSKIQLSGHPMPNGSFIFPFVRDDTQSLAASLFAEVPLSLITESDVRELLSDEGGAISEENLIAPIPVTPQQLAAAEAYQIAFAHLTREGEMLEGLEYPDVSGQVVGDFVLITLPDSEEFTPTLCVATGFKVGQQYVIGRQHAQGQQYVLAFLISYYDMASMREAAALAALDRIYTFTSENDISLPNFVEVRPAEGGSGRGSRGLMTPRFNLSPGGFHIELKYWTIAVAGMRYMPRMRRTRTQPVSGFTWSALLSYDADRRSLDLTSISAPRPINSFDYLTPVNRYFDALADAGLRDMKIDVSNFTKAAMRRQNFGAAVKPDYIDFAGEIVII
jgi:hypothetical protein